MDPPTCQEPLDIVFIIDGSKSVKKERFEKSKAFFKDVVSRMNERTLVSAVTYSEEVTLNFPFTAGTVQPNLPTLNVEYHF